MGQPGYGERRRGPGNPVHLEAAIKILHVVHGYTPALGGIQSYVQNISERLVAQYGDEVTVFTTVAYSNHYFWDRSQPALQPGVERINGVTVRRFPVINRAGGLRLNLARVAYRLRLPGNDWLRGLYFGPLIRGMTQAIAASGADLALAASFPLLHMHYALWGGERAGIPTVLLGALHPLDRWCFDRAMIFNAIRRCTAYVALTGWERRYLIERGVPPARIHVLGGGVEAGLFEQADGSALRRRRDWGDDPVIATVAQHAPHKRIDLLIRAMPAVWDRFPRARLAVAGSPTAHTPDLERLVRGLPAEQQARIHLLGQVSEQDKAELLAACDLLANPSSHESFGLVFLEAWACGKPVIGSRVAAIPAVIDEGVTGLLVRYGDVGDLAQAISALLGDPPQRARMGAAGRQKVLAHYTWDSVTERLRGLYCQLLAGDAAAEVRE